MTFFVGILRVPIFWLTPSDIRLMESKFGHFDQNLLPPDIFLYGPYEFGPKFHKNALSRERLVVERCIIPQNMRNHQVLGGVQRHIYTFYERKGLKIDIL